MGFYNYLRSVALLVFSLLVACDSAFEWREGPYSLLWIDDPHEIALVYDLGDGAHMRLVDSQVFAVGANDLYVVAKQHPDGNKQIINYFIISRFDDSLDNPLPLTAEDYAQKKRELALPEFTHVLESLQ